MTTMSLEPVAMEQCFVWPLLVYEIVAMVQSSDLGSQQSENPIEDNVIHFASR